MYFPKVVVLLSTAATIQAISLEGLTNDVVHYAREIKLPGMIAGKRALRNPFEGRQDGCPEVWGSIAEELKWRFLANGECTDAARAAIRAAFHDCFPGQGCDGSLFLAQEFTRERENGGLAPISEDLGKLAQAKGVSVADMFQFAGGEFHKIVILPSRLFAFLCAHRPQPTR